MNKPKAVLFDLDGTLVDTLADLAAATNTALAHIGHAPYPLDDYRHMVGNGARLLIARAVGKDATDPLTERVLADFLAIYADHCLDETRPYDGILPMLDALGDTPLAVVTNKPEPQARTIVHALFGDRFRTVCGGRADRPKKPDPQGTRDTLAALGLTTEDVWFVGDSDVDMRTAQNAGLIGIGAAWGFRGAAELQAAGAYRVIAHPRELLALL